jgi:uncharacterized protein YraI
METANSPEENTTMKGLLATTGLGLCLLATASAFAAEGYVTHNARLRAGPDVSYPTVLRLRAGTAVDIEGCVDNWSWCDVGIGEDRGWIAGNYLQQEYQGRRVLVPSYGVRIGIPIISFVFGSYWNDHYRHRSWYGNRDHWSHVRPHYGSIRVDERRHSDGISRDTTRSASYRPNSSVLHASEPSRQTAVAAPHRSYQERSRATVAPQPSSVREQPSMHDGGDMARRAEHNATTAAPARHEAMPSAVVVHHDASQSGSMNGRRDARQPRDVAEARAPHASARGMQEKSAHGHGNAPERGNKGKDRDKGKDKDNGKGG